MQISPYLKSLKVEQAPICPQESDYPLSRVLKLKTAVLHLAHWHRPARLNYLFKPRSDLVSAFHDRVDEILDLIQSTEDFRLEVPVLTDPLQVYIVFVALLEIQQAEAIVII